MFERIIDPRIEQVRKIVETMVSKKLFWRTNVLVEGNKVIIVVDDTVLFMALLKGVEPNIYPTISFNYASIYEFENPNECINDVMLANRLISLENFYFNNHQLVLVAKEDNMRSNPEFEELLNLNGSTFMGSIGCQLILMDEASSMSSPLNNEEKIKLMYAKKMVALSKLSFRDKLEFMEKISSRKKRLC